MITLVSCKFTNLGGWLIVTYSVGRGTFRVANNVRTKPAQNTAMKGIRNKYLLAACRFVKTWNIFRLIYNYMFISRVDTVA